MKRFKNLLILIAFSLFLIPFSSAQLDCEVQIPPVKQNSCVELIQTCSNCSFVNLTAIYYPQLNGTIEYPNAQMTQNTNNYNYTFCETENLGTYIYSTQGDPDGQHVTQNVCFQVTRNGSVLTGVQGALYFVPLFLFGFLVFFLGHRFFISSTIFSKAIYFLLTYIFGLLPLTYILYELVNNYLSAQEFIINVLYYFFIILVFLAPIVFIVCAAYLVIDLVNNSMKRKLVSRGYREEDADKKAYRRK